MLFPATCILCDSTTQNALDICSDCFRQLPHNQHCCTSCALPLPYNALSSGKCGACLSDKRPISDAVIPFLYQPPADFMVQRLKFNNELKYGRLMGELVANAASDKTPADLLVPVPQHDDRLLQRGFNHAAQIAGIIGKRLSIDVDYTLVQKVSATTPQAGLNARQRKANQRNVFHTMRDIEVEHIAIVDDVLTTGATCNALASVLIKSGCRKVSVWAFARTP